MCRAKKPKNDWWELTILTAQPLPSRLAHTLEGGLDVDATLRALLVARERSTLVTDFWFKRHKPTGDETAWISPLKTDPSLKCQPLTRYTGSKVWWDVWIGFVVVDANTVGSQTHCNKKKMNDGPGATKDAEHSKKEN